MNDFKPLLKFLSIPLYIILFMYVFSNFVLSENGGPFLLIAIFWPVLFFIKKPTKYSNVSAIKFYPIRIISIFLSIFVFVMCMFSIFSMLFHPESYLDVFGLTSFFILILGFTPISFFIGVKASEFFLNYSIKKTKYKKKAAPN
ncbi:MAG: hypothetical protein WCP14_02245 [bacterium]